LLAEILRVGAIYLSNSNPSLAAQYLAIAYRLLTSAGLLGVRTEVERTATALGLSPERVTPATDPLSLFTRVGVLLKLGRHPAILGRELLLLLQQLLPSLHASISAERPDTAPRIVASLGPPPAEPHQPADDDIAICLGETGSATYWLRAPRSPDAPDPLVWSAVQQVVHAALALHGRRSPPDPAYDHWHGDSPAIQLGMVVVADRTLDLLDTARKIAPSPITVLITGETGTGKELLARAIHEASPRASRPFVPFNCSAVPRDMLDAQLFGHRRGAFTGATDAFEGVIRAARGGTLFLDEIGEVTLDVQPKLLRFLESGEIHPLGEPRPLHVDVRVIAATNAKLEALVAEGRFREDLFYRLNVVRLQVPPLRERREEIPPLVQFYLEKCSRETGKSGLRVADETMEYLILYKWPGNVRQLANEIRRLVALAESGAVLMPEHLSHEIASSRRTIPASERPLAQTEVVVRMDQPMSAATEHLERAMIQYALRRSGGRLEEAAERLGLSRKGLYLKRQRLGLADFPVGDAAQ
jgi:DNA-binding NtrC family response regulator